MNAQKFAVGQTLHAATAMLESSQTRPPEHYTESSLMDDMMSAYKFAKNENDRVMLKQIAGLGTSRTRGVIIKGFVDRRFLSRQKKAKLYQLKITHEGRNLLSNLPDQIKDVTLTAKWERALAMVADGSAKPEQLRAKVDAMLVDLIGKLLPVSVKI